MTTNRKGGGKFNTDDIKRKLQIAETPERKQGEFLADACKQAILEVIKGAGCPIELSDEKLSKIIDAYLKVLSKMDNKSDSHVDEVTMIYFMAHLQRYCAKGLGLSIEVVEEQGEVDEKEIAKLSKKELEEWDKERTFKKDTLKTPSVINEESIYDILTPVFMVANKLSNDAAVYNRDFHRSFSWTYGIRDASIREGMQKSGVVSHLRETENTYLTAMHAIDKKLTEKEKKQGVFLNVSRERVFEIASKIRTIEAAQSKEVKKPDMAPAEKAAKRKAKKDLDGYASDAEKPRPKK